MAYNEEKLTKLRSLKALAERIDRDFARKAELEALDSKVNQLTATGGEPNVITGIKVNGAVQAVTDKVVDIAMPVKVSELDNDSKFQTEQQVAAAVAGAGHLKRRIVDSADAIDTAADDAGQYIYMVAKDGGKSGDMYDEYMVMDGAVERVGDWSVDLSGYVQAETGKGLSSNDFTDADKARLDGVAEGATKVEAGETNGSIKVNGTKLAVYTEPSDVIHGTFATDAEVTEMLNGVFGANA